jgi:hypothetical protein
MARTKTPKTAQRTASSTPVMDPWDIEHQRSLATHGPMASTNAIYPITVHRGFEADLEAQPLTRRYPIFEETVSHREFLVRSRSERLITTGERDNYYTPEQLWEEDDRMRERMQFARSGEPSWVDEEPYSSDEEEAVGPVVQQSREEDVGEEERSSDEEEAEGAVVQPSSKKRSRDSSSPPADTPDVPEAKKRKTAAPSTKGRRKA